MTTKGLRDLWSIIATYGGFGVKNAEVDDSYFGVGLYTVAEAAAILSFGLKKTVTQINLRRWAHGRSRFGKKYPAIIQPTFGVVEGANIFTFTDIIELFTIAALRQEGAKMNAVYAAYQTAREEFGERPFARKKYSNFGSSIFPTKVDYHGEMVDLATGRRAFEEIISPLLHEIVIYTDDLPVALAPLGKEKTVMLDPSRSFGAPINRDTGVLTRILYGMHEAGESEETVAKWYDVTVEGVRDAIDYESALLKAA